MPTAPITAGSNASPAIYEIAVRALADLAGKRAFLPLRHRGPRCCVGRAFAKPDLGPVERIDAVAQEGTERATFGRRPASPAFDLEAAVRAQAVREGLNPDRLHPEDRASIEGDIHRRIERRVLGGYRMRRVRSDSAVALDDIFRPTTPAETMRAIDEVLATRNSENPEATLAGLLRALALDGIFGEDVPAGRAA